MGKHSAEHDDTAEQAGGRRNLAQEQKGKQDGERYFGRAEQPGFSRGDEPGAFRPQYGRQCEGRPEGHQQNGIPQ